MPTLLEIGQDMAALEQLLAESAESGGDITTVESTLTKWFSELGEQQSSKIDGYCALIRELELRSAARKEESERLAKRVKVDEAQAKFLQVRLKDHLEQHGLKKIETERFTVGIVNNGGKVPLELTQPPERLPTQYQRIKTEVSADADKIREALERGEQLGFATLGKRGTRLSIR